MTPGESVPSTPGTWLDQHTARAPEALRRKVAEYAGRVVGPSITPESLAAAGQIALQHALERPDDRSAALDLLAADALVTLALLAQAEQDPRGLAAFAQDILQTLRPGS